MTNEASNAATSIRPVRVRPWIDKESSGSLREMFLISASVAPTDGERFGIEVDEEAQLARRSSSCERKSNEFERASMAETQQGRNHNCTRSR